MSQYDYDVVIVGAGITGGLMAEQIAGKGLKVLVLEAGVATTNRQDHIDTFYAASDKDVGSPYPPQPDAPRPASPDLSWRKLRPVTEQYFIETGDVPLGSTFERMEGGTTNHWLGTCLREEPNTFRMKSKYGVFTDWPEQISTASLDRYYSQAEKAIGVSGNPDNDNYLGIQRSQPYPMGPIPQSYLDQIVSGKLDRKAVTLDGNEMELRVFSTPQGRNSISYDHRPACMGNTSCVPICPIRAKFDAGVAVARAKAKGAVIQYQSVVVKVVVDEQTRAVTSLEYFLYQKGSSGREGAVRKSVTAKRFVIAAHAIETAKLLLMSDVPRGGTVANSSGQVGLNLMDNICQVSWGLMPEPIYPYRGPLSTSGIPTFRDGPFRDKFSAFIIEIGNDGWSWPVFAPGTTVMELMAGKYGYPPVYGKKLRGAMADVMARQFRMAFEFEGLPTPKSYIKPATEKEYGQSAFDQLGVPRPVVNYTFTDPEMQNGNYVADAFMQVAGNTRHGIEGVGPAIFRLLGITPENDFTSVQRDQPCIFNYEGQDYQFRGAGHLFGTARMGADRKTSVVNWEQRSWDHQNLFIVGCTVFPTSGTANPTLTAAALSLWAADTIIKDLTQS